MAAGVVSLGRCTPVGVGQGGPTTYTLCAATSNGVSLSVSGGASWTNFTTAQGLASNNVNAVCLVPGTLAISLNPALQRPPAGQR
ncbi:MAG: hypothetical protein ACLQDL_04505 [Spirochaetia bacterium]